MAESGMDIPVIAIHVVPHREGWALRYDRADKVFCILPSKDEALRKAREHAGPHAARILIHASRSQLRQFVRTTVPGT